MSVPNRARGIWRLRAKRPSPTFQALEPVQRFIHTEVTGGAVLFAFAVLALVLANSPLSGLYHDFWETPVGLEWRIGGISDTLHHWVNDGLMTLFFFAVGLEIKRELVIGELSNARSAMVPAFAALGGMVVPAGLYVVVNVGGPGLAGWGIPMATDIAFSLAVLALLGDRVPNQARVFLLALAIVDDVGAILVIALFYSGSINLAGLAAAAGIFAVTLGVRQLGVRALTVYWVLGIGLWFALGTAGVHATMAGVLLALITPAKPDFDHDAFESIGPGLMDRFEAARADENPDTAESVLGQLEELSRRTESPLERLQRTMHPWSTYVVLPLFALANAGVALDPGQLPQTVTRPVFIGVALGLAVGKVVGVVAATKLATAVFGGELPPSVTLRHVVGIGLLAGIGFTVALFIGDLAFSDTTTLRETAKLGIMVGSVVSGVAGYAVLRWGAAES